MSHKGLKLIRRQIDATATVGPCADRIALPWLGESG